MLPVSSSTMLSTPSPKRIWTPTGINVYKKVYEKSDAKLIEHIKQTSFSTYHQHAKEEQVEAVFNLVKGRNTFLLAGTGFGKSRIAEIYYKMIPQKSRGVVLVLNPLDSLGDNQVLEKQQAGFTAINLTKLTFNPDVAQEIMDGVYQFVYLSPEIFLNSKLFERCYFSNEFQNRLALIVVDEAHMVYIWGLVESSTSKTSTSAHFCFEDYGIFRPSYGKLGAQLLFRNDKPILLLSATCRPVAVEAIKKSLKLNNDSIDMIRAELTRPEIRMIRLTMEKSLASSLDVIRLFPSHKHVADSDMVPSLVYSGSRNRTLTVLEVIDRAHETPGGAFIPNSLCARRFHSCTGEEDKISCASDFATGDFPIISCTMALGLGQNWKRVRMVSHIGRGDPANICQMIGRCGRDGRPGLAVMMVEKTRRGGKNSIEQFTRGAVQTDLDRMDALAITPLCLRVAFSIDNRLGYVPLWPNDENYLTEKAREEKAGFPMCRCSNCAPGAAINLMEGLVFANKLDFDSLLNDTFVPTHTYDLKHKYPSRAITQKKRKFSDSDQDELENFALLLVADWHHYYDTEVSPGGTIQASDLFGKDESDSILDHLDHINEVSDLRSVVGGESYVGESDWLFKWITEFKSNTLAVRNSSTSTNVSKKPRKSQKNEESNRQSLLGIGPAPRPMSKKALAQAESQRKALERQAAKKLEEERNTSRRLQVAEIMSQTLAEHANLTSGHQTDCTKGH
ncbi:ATP-dependent DNA helicase sgs1 [Puccinia graminis f. sp. tritici]|uniref:DNA 3'-5' helicase n=1 Tax=Puccinia graminis f. sp. tritici TaxID=56615 RepID=A0A5B0Q6Y2_PUCGR|nr:ATP-dependent DNA helicase sgs1 [Puccinia graminis f. sp. tritici]